MFTYITMYSYRRFNAGCLYFFNHIIANCFPINLPLTIESLK